MAFVAKQLTRQGGFAIGGVKRSLWAYGTDESVATVVGSGYFNNATVRLKKGDLILIASAIATTPVAGLAIVTSASGAATVTTAAMPIA
jgi:hypothetical protein